MKSIIAAIAVLACTLVSAQKITSSRPAMNQVLVAGAATQIVWAPVDGVISTIDLRQGDKIALNFLQTVATNVPANAGSYTWNVPADLPAGTDYALSFGQSPDDTYTPFFAISAGNGTAPVAPPAASNSAPAAGSSVAPKPTGSAANSPVASKSGAAPSTSPSGSAASKNSVAVGALAVAGAVAAALI